jgi:hypothetical protein
LARLNISTATHLARGFTLSILIAFSVSSTVAQDVSLSPIPATLPPAVIDKLAAVRTELLNRLEAHNQKVDAFNSSCAQVEVNTALFSECTQKDKALSAEAATLVEDKKGFAAQLNSAIAANTSEDSDEKSVQESDRVTIKREIEGIQNALRQLNKSMTLDASQREEWEKESEQATHDSWALAGSATLDLIGAHADAKVKSQDKELKHCLDLLSGTVEPDRREQLHTAYAVLKDRKDELERLHSAIETVHDAYDINADLTDVKYEGDNPQALSEHGLEAIWKAGEKLKIIPPQASVAKTYVDLSYLVAEQAASALRLGALNRNSDEYLAATKVLKARMETLVKAQKALE